MDRSRAHRCEAPSALVYWRSRSIMDRRRFLIAAGALVPALVDEGRAQPERRSRIVVAKRSGIVTEGGAVDAHGVRELLGRASAAYYDTEDVAEAWATAFADAGRIGIKVNCLGGWGMSTRPELALAACHWLGEAGIPMKRVVVWDRISRELEAAGYDLSSPKDGPGVFGTDWTGAGYERHVRDYRSIGSCFSRILTTMCDAQLNMPVAKDHGLCGITGALKNWFGGIHNPNKWHMNRCDPYIADLNDMELVRGNQRLVVLDMLLAQCHGGPAYNPRYRWAYQGLVVSEDPVATDAYLRRVVDERRARLGLPSLLEDGRAASYLGTAAQYGLGQERLENVEVVEVE